MDGRGHRAFRVAGQAAGQGIDEGRRNLGLVPLHVDHDGVFGQFHQRDGFGQPLGARGMVGTGHDGFVPMGTGHVGDPGAVGGNGDPDGL